MQLHIRDARIRTEGPDSDGDYRVEASCTVRADGGATIDALRQTQLIRSAEGLPMLLDSAEHDDELDDGDSAEIATGTFQKIGDLRGCTGTIRVVAYAKELVRLGHCRLPRPTTFEGSAETTALGRLTVPSWSVSCTPPDRDGDVSVRALVLLENTGDTTVDKVEGRLVMTRKNGMELDYAWGSEEGIAPGQTRALECSTYIKSKWVEREVHCELRLTLSSAVAEVTTGPLAIEHQPG